MFFVLIFAKPLGNTPLRTLEKFPNFYEETYIYVIIMQQQSYLPANTQFKFHHSNTKTEIKIHLIQHFERIAMFSFHKSNKNYIKRGHIFSEVKHSK